jgi:iron complex transport system substrate-binding protein
MRHAAQLITVFVMFTAVNLCAAAGDAVTTRIVSLVPSITETLFAVGAAEQVVGTSEFCNWPEAAKRKPKVGGFINPNIEKIVSSRPNVVFILNSQSELERKLGALGIKSAVVRSDGLQDVFSSFEPVVQWSGCTTATQLLEQNIRHDLERIEAKYTTGTAKRTLVIVGRQPATLQNLYAAGSDTYLGQVLQIAGGKNIAPAGSHPYPPLSKEQVISLDPEVIIDTSLGEAGVKAAVVEAHKKVWDQLPMISAVKNKRIHYITDPYLTIPGPSISKTAETIAELLHSAP